MEDFLAYTVLGLVTAAIYAVAASGLVVTYTTSGVFNFAHGAVGMMAAFLFWQLHVDWGLSWPLALAIILVVIAPLFGWVIDRVIMRGLAGTTEVTRIVVSVGILFGLVSLAPIIWPPTQRSIRPFLGADTIAIGTVNVTQHQLAIMGIAVLVALVLRVVLFGTRSGVAMRAVVDSRSLARLHGARPDRSSALSWALGSSLAALAGILVANQLGLEVLALTLLVVNAYAAAVVGRLTSLPMTFLGAVILGLAQSYAVGYLPKNPQWLSDLDIEVVTSMRLAIPVVMLFIVLLLLPHAPLRAAGIQRARESVAAPEWRRSLLGVGFVVSATIVLSGMLSNADLVAWGKLFAYGMIMLSLVPLTGYGGQISLAQLSFAGIGALAVGRWGADGSPLGVVLAVVLAAAVGAIVALPALRLRGIYLALATMAFAVFMDRVVFTQQALFLGGSLPVDRPKLGPFDVSSNRGYVVMMAVLFCAVALGVVWLRRGPFGRRLLAMKDSPAACATLGLNLTVTKLQVFALSAAIAGLGGAMLAGLQGVATPTDYELLRGLPILLLAVAGGISMISGSMLGGTFLASFAVISTWVPEQWEIAGFNARNAVVNLLLVAPALMGISLARNPNGAAHEIGTKVLGALNRGGGTGVEAPELPADPETLGIDLPLHTDDIAAVDAYLGLDEEVIGAAAGGG